jgi:hypothetical protein
MEGAKSPRFWLTLPHEILSACLATSHKQDHRDLYIRQDDPAKPVTRLSCFGFRNLVAPGGLPFGDALQHRQRRKNGSIPACFCRRRLIFPHRRSRKSFPQTYDGLF